METNKKFFLLLTDVIGGIERYKSFPTKSALTSYLNQQTVDELPNSEILEVELIEKHWPCISIEKIEEHKNAIQ